MNEDDWEYVRNELEQKCILADEIDKKICKIT